jgi:hypothetical protein
MDHELLKGSGDPGLNTGYRGKSIAIRPRYPLKPKAGGQKMHQKAILKTLLLAVLAVTYAIGCYQPADAKTDKEKEEETYEKHKELKGSIKKNQTPEDVLLIMGDPEEIEVLQRGSDEIVLWYYDGRDVRVEFRNDLVSTWFIRFMPDKPQKEKQKEPKEKCSLCEQSKKPKKEGK